MFGVDPPPNSKPVENADAKPVADKKADTAKDETDNNGAAAGDLPPKKLADPVAVPEPDAKKKKKKCCCVIS